MKCISIVLCNGGKLRIFLEIALQVIGWLWFPNTSLLWRQVRTISRHDPPSDRLAMIPIQGRTRYSRFTGLMTITSSGYECYKEMSNTFIKSNGGLFLKRKYLPTLKIVWENYFKYVKTLFISFPLREIHECVSY